MNVMYGLIFTLNISVLLKMDMSKNSWIFVERKISSNLSSCKSSAEITSDGMGSIHYSVPFPNPGWGVGGRALKILPRDHFEIFTFSLISNCRKTTRIKMFESYKAEVNLRCDYVSILIGRYISVRIFETLYVSVISLLYLFDFKSTH